LRQGCQFLPPEGKVCSGPSRKPETAGPESSFTERRESHDPVSKDVAILCKVRRRTVKVGSQTPRYQAGLIASGDPKDGRRE
jgi:hypothetical protein